MSASAVSASFLRRRQSLRYRIQALPRLRALVGLGPREDIRPAQWGLIERQLTAASERLLQRVAQVEAVADTASSRDHNAALGEIELDLSKAYTFFDTYMDVLTQRRSAELGPSWGDATSWRRTRSDALTRRCATPSDRSSTAIAGSVRRFCGKEFRCRTAASIPSL